MDGYLSPHGQRAVTEARAKLDELLVLDESAKALGVPDVGPEYSLVAKIYVEEQIKLVDSQAAELISLRGQLVAERKEVARLTKLVGDPEKVMARLVRERDDAINEANQLKLALDDIAWRMHKAARDTDQYRMDD